MELIIENDGLGEFYSSSEGMVESTRYQQAKSSDQKQIATDIANDLTEMLLVSSFADASNEEAEAQAEQDICQYRTENSSADDSYEICVGCVLTVQEYHKQDDLDYPTKKGFEEDTCSDSATESCRDMAEEPTKDFGQLPSQLLTGETYQIGSGYHCNVIENENP